MELIQQLFNQLAYIALTKAQQILVWKRIEEIVSEIIFDLESEL